MKATIAVLAFLIVGTNAAMIGNLLNPVLDAATALNQLQGILSNLTGQVNQATSSAEQVISDQLQGTIQVFEEGEKEVLAVAQNLLNAAEAGELSSEIANTLAQLRAKSHDALSKIKSALDELDTEIVSNVISAIKTLSSNIVAGAKKLKCFIDTIPTITLYVNRFVNTTQERIQASIDQISEQMANHRNDIKANLTEIKSNFQIGEDPLKTALQTVSK